MSKRAHKNDISIGEERWIEFGHLDADWAHASPIDPILAPIMPFLEQLETNCVAGCCGIDAFALWPEDIKEAVGNLDKERIDTLAASLISVRNVIHEIQTDLVSSTRLNQSFHKEAFLRLLTHLRQVVENCSFTKRL